MVACINIKGSTKPACNDIARDIWLWCLERHNFISAVHIPGSTNIEADFESRVDRHEFSRVLWGSLVDVTLIFLHSWNHMFLGDQIQMLWLLMPSLWIGPNVELFVFLLSVWYQGCCRRWTYIKQSVWLWCLFGQFRVVHQTVITTGRLSRSTAICATSSQSSSVWSAASSSAKDETDSMFLVREALENRGIRKDSTDIIMSGWREGKEMLSLLH